MAMKEVYLLSVKSSCTRSGLISDISEVLSPFNVKILDVAQVLPPKPFKGIERVLLEVGRLGHGSFFVGKQRFFGTPKVCPLPLACPLNPAPEYSHYRPLSTSGARSGALSPPLPPCLGG